MEDDTADKGGSKDLLDLDGDAQDSLPGKVCVCVTAGATGCSPWMDDGRDRLPAGSFKSYFTVNKWSMTAIIGGGKMVVTAGCMNV